MLRKTLDGIQAGIMISIGGSIFLACENRVVGSVLFSVALLTICLKSYALFTGKVGYIAEKHGKEEFTVLFLALLGNFLGTFICGILIRAGLPNLGEIAFAICSSKLTQPLLSTFIRGIFCGVLMYVAVSIYREKSSISGILFCVPVFILSGFEHSIADMFYFAVSGIVSAKAFLFIWIVIFGNSLGGMLLPALGIVGKKAPANEK